MVAGGLPFRAFSLPHENGVCPTQRVRGVVAVATLHVRLALPVADELQSEDLGEAKHA